MRMALIVFAMAGGVVWGGCGDACSSACDKLFDCSGSVVVSGYNPATYPANLTRDNCPDRCRNSDDPGKTWADCVNQHDSCAELLACF